MPLDPQARALLDMTRALGAPDISQLEPAEARAMAAVRPAGPRKRVARVEDLAAPGPAGDVPVRLYVPEVGEPPPVLVFFHGGGFVLCDLDSHDPLCRELALAAGCAVVSVDYRLAPEHPFPAAPEDCHAATRWVALHGAALGLDGGRLAVGGDSAGGNLAAAVALMARDRGGPPLCHQLLVYPMIDRDFERPSFRENADGYLLTARMVEWFWRHYLPGGTAGRPAYATPLRADDLAGLPPALVLSAEFDPLRDEAEAYAARLRAAGVPTTLTRYDGMIHGFFSMGDTIDRGREAVSQAAAALSAAFAVPRAVPVSSGS